MAGALCLQCSPRPSNWIKRAYGTSNGEGKNKGEKGREGRAEKEVEGRQVRTGEGKRREERVDLRVAAVQKHDPT